MAEIVADMESAARAVLSTAAVIIVTVCACASMAWRIRLADALRPKDAAEREADEPEAKPAIDAALTFSSQEILQSIDFEKMSAAEMASAKQATQELS